MRRGRASSTSSLVALMRAVADAGITDVRDFHDPTALVLLPEGWQRAGRWLIRSLSTRSAARQRFLDGASGRMDIVALRTCVLDDAWHASHAASTRQLVLLGAGLDGRAFRLDDLADSAVFEVDHPATQSLKRERARALTVRARHHHYVPVNFERDRLADELERAGHRADQPTQWIWEGVTPYLTADAQEQTLAAVASRSARGSRLALTYIEPLARDRADASFKRGIYLFVRALGEPFIGLVSREELRRRLERHGFDVLDDTGPTEWRLRYSARTEGELSTFQERIAVAEKR